MMCDRCIYRRICKLVEGEMAKTAADTSCHRFREEPPLPTADCDPDMYLI